MLSPAIHGMLAQAHVEQLHRTAQNSNRRSATAVSSGDLNHPVGVPLLMRAKRALRRVLDDGGVASSDEAFAIYGVQFAGHPPNASRSQDR